MKTISTIAFVYGKEGQTRQHGPGGYTDVQSFRQWLRDDFVFRCVYCLAREQWSKLKGEFDIEHFVPNSISPEFNLKYDNLVYACHSCNLKKGSEAVPDPLNHLNLNSIVVLQSGLLFGLTQEAKQIISKVALNSPEMVRWRIMWIRLVDLATEHDEELLQQLMSYPEDIPNLSLLNPPVNDRPNGPLSSCFARRNRNELPDTYVN